MNRYFTELVGTFLFVFSIALAVAHAGAFAPLAIGVALMCVVYMGGHVSGGHYNPAVTLAVYLRGGFSAKDIAPYMIAQLVGASLAAWLASGIDGMAFMPAPGPGESLTAALIVEIVFGFALCVVVLNVATDRAVEGNSFYGLAIGMTVMVGAYAAGGISGGAFNPAVGLGPVPFAAGSKAVGHAWIYLVGPGLGGVLAAFAFRAMHFKEAAERSG